ncbi:MAG: chitobiase/beta-hexosaminidase C-terminal domain-containing protein, partial [Kofleriaceae bacterium]|nr:chitobiase/beta-hexosaminidase C-terminal domain-containing protein [Kofleriaceae bacterium]
MRWGLTTSILLVLVGCGKVDPADFDTVPPITTAVPPPGAFAIAPTAVNLVSNEATTIYYTTDGTEPTLASTAAASPLAIRTISDGTTITFFAVDEAGNQEVVQRATYSFDGA